MTVPYHIDTSHALAAGLVADWAPYDGATLASLVSGVPDVTMDPLSSYTAGPGTFGRVGNFTTNNASGQLAIGSVLLGGLQPPVFTAMFSFRRHNTVADRGAVFDGSLSYSINGYGTARATIWNGNNSFVEADVASPFDDAWGVGAIVADGTNVTAYARGVAGTPVACSAVFYTYTYLGTAALRLGGNGELSKPVEMEWFRIWNRALTPTEMNAVIASPFAWVVAGSGGAPATRNPLAFIA